MTRKNGRIPLTLEGIKRALVESGSPEARRKYVASLRQQVAVYEKRYRLRSELLREALRSGRLKENLDVAEWALAVDSLDRLDHGREARLERPRKLPAHRAARTR